MNEFENHIKANQVKYEKLRKKITEILGEADYYGLYNFFKGLLSNTELTYLIIMSRRCLVLCQIFIIFIIADKCHLNEKLIVLSDKAIPYYANKLKGKIAIADDILIHGRTIRNIYKLLNKLNKEEMETSIFGYKKDIDLDCMSDELKAITTVCSEEYKTEWRKLSNKIVKCIYASNVPYTSFVTSYFQYDNKSILDKIKGKKEIKCIDNAEVSQKEQGLNSWYCYEETEIEQFPLFEKLLLSKGVRLYWNDNIEKLTIIPYVFIKRISLEDARELFYKLSASIPSKYKAINDILKEEYEDKYINNTLIAYKMRLLTCLFSRGYWEDFLKRHKLDDIYSIDVDTMDKSFGKEITQEIISMKDEELAEILKIELDISVCSEQIEMKLMELFKKCKGGKKADNIKRYFHKAWYEDECRALENEERSQGVSIDYCIEYLEKDLSERQEVLASLVNIWDMGIAAANYAVDKMGNYVACYNTPGEQSYRIIIENYPYVFRSLISVSKLLRKSDVKDDRSFEQYRQDVLIDLLDELHKDQEIEDYEDLKNIIKSEKGYLNPWNQIEIIECAEKLDLRKNQKDIVVNFINNNI